MIRHIGPETVTALSHIDTLALLGGSGFIGSSLLRLILETKAIATPHIKLATRDLAKNKFDFLPSSARTKDKVEIIECNHLKIGQVRNLINGADVVIDLAGLAWQHPGGQPTPKLELLKREILENAVSALLLATELRPEQKLIWTSTSAIEGMFARLSTTDNELLRQEADQFAEKLISSISVDANPETYQAAIGELISQFSFLELPKALQLPEKVMFATEFSYAYSKYIGQLILEKLSRGNIRAVQISDVYGPGQDISPRILDPNLPARRIQRYIAAYHQISQGQVDWIPTTPDAIYGFSRETDGSIIQYIWSDDVFPTHVQDICEVLLRSTQLDSEIKKTVLAVNGNRLTNQNLMQMLRDYFDVTVRIVADEALTYTMPQHSEDLPLIGMSGKKLISFKEALVDWVESDAAKVK